LVPSVGPTGPISVSATPATPARPEPMKKVSWSTLPVLHDGPHPATLPQAGEVQRDRGDAADRQDQDEDPVVRQPYAADVEPAGEPAGRGDLDVRGTEDVPGHLLEDQADAPRQQQRVQRPAVEPPDHQPFQDQPEHAADHERDGQSDRHGLAADQRLHQERGVGAGHDELSVRHVDDAHLAEGEGEAEGGEQQHRADARPDDQLVECSHDRRLPAQDRPVAQL
jgi:hypothetical protein